MARLFLVTDGNQQVRDLGAVNSLGRHPNNTIQLLDKIVSKEHCIVELRGDTYVLRDLGSLNGTYVNGQRVQGEQMLRHGDDLALGATRGRFDDGSGRPMPPLPWAAGSAAGAPGGPGAQVAPGSPGAPYSDPTAAQPRPQNYAPEAATGAQSPGVYGPTASFPERPHQGPPAYQQNQGPPAYQQNQGLPAYQQAPAPGRPAPPQSYVGVRPAAPTPVSGAAAGYAQPQAPSPAYGSTAPLAPGRPLPVPGTPISATYQGTRIDVQNEDRAIGTQIAATSRGFLPFDQIAPDAQLVRSDYERLRLSHELSSEIALELDTTKLLEKILNSIFKFIRADRGVIFLKDLVTGELVVGSSRRRDGTDAPIAVSGTIMNHVMKERAAVLTHDAAMDFAASKGKSMILNRISSAIVVPLLHNDEVLGVLWLDSETLAQFQRKDLELVTAVSNQAAMFIEINILAKKVEHEIVTRERFSRLLSPNLAERVISGELEVKKGGQLVKECTVFNSDIRGFTSMSERAEPQVIVDMLNEYCELMVEVLFKFEGTLDKFMGDGIMALWGAPVQHPDDAVRAVQCAIDQMRVLGEFNRARLGRNERPLAIGIGIHTGPLVAGYIGSSKALSYTVIGDTANTSARLCGKAEPGQIIVSEATYARLGARFEYEELAPVMVKNKEKPIPIFNVLGERPMVQVPGKVGSA